MLLLGYVFNHASVLKRISSLISTVNSNYNVKLIIKY